MKSVIASNSETTQEQSSYTNEDYLRFTQARRVQFVKAIESAVGDEEGLATLDPERQSNYLKALSDLDKQVLSIQKLKQEEQNNDAHNAAIASLILDATRRVSSQRNQLNTASVIPDGSMLPVKTLVPGELDIGDRIETFQEYKSRTGLSASQDPVQDDQE